MCCASPNFGFASALKTQIFTRASTHMASWIDASEATHVGAKKDSLSSTKTLEIPVKKERKDAPSSNSKDSLTSSKQQAQKKNLKVYMGTSTIVTLLVLVPSTLLNFFRESSYALKKRMNTSLIPDRAPESRVPFEVMANGTFVKTYHEVLFRSTSPWIRS